MVKSKILFFFTIPIILKSMKNKIEFKNVSFSYMDDGAKAVDGISFVVEEGEFLAILGHNGSGKSTTAKMINGLLIPDSGEVFVSGLSTSVENNLWEIRKNCGMVFQNPDNQLIATIVEDDVAFGPENLGVPPAEIRKRVDESLKTVEMYDFISRAPHQLSGGQKQRISIAGVLAMEPSCIVFDEPTAMLDPIGRREVLKTIINLHKKGITVVLITHHLEEAMFSDRVIVMKNGKIALEGSPLDVFSKVDKMESLSLTVPEVIRMSNALKKRGIDIKENVIEYKELVESIWQYTQKI